MQELFLKWVFEGSLVAILFTLMNFFIHRRFEPLLGYAIAIILDIIDRISLAFTNAFLSLISAQGSTLPPLGHTLVPLLIVLIVGIVLGIRYYRPSTRQIAIAIWNSTLQIVIAIGICLGASWLFQTTPYTVWVLFPLPGSIAFYILEINQLMILSALFLPFEGRVETVLVFFALIFLFVSQLLSSIQIRLEKNPGLKNLKNVFKRLESKSRSKENSWRMRK